MANTRLLLLLAALFAGLSPTVTAAAQQLQRLNVGDLRLYYTSRSPSSIHYRGEPLITGIYLYTAVQEPDGTSIEGFNFRRDEDGLLKSAAEDVPGGKRLTWENTRHVYRGARRSEKPAGTGKIVLTLTTAEVSLRCTGKIEPNPGFGEIGFFVPEAALTAGDTATWQAALLDKSSRTGTLPLPAADQGTLLLNPTEVAFTSPRGAFAFAFSGFQFPGGHGLHVQDYRRQDTSRGCLRFVTNFSTVQGNAFDYTWTLRIPSRMGERENGRMGDAGRPLSHSPTPPFSHSPILPLSHSPVLPLSHSPILGAAKMVRLPNLPPASAGEGLSLQVGNAGQFTLLDGAQPIAQRDYCWLAGGTPVTEESQEGGARRVTVTWNSDRGRVVKQAVVTADEAWLSWTLQPRQPFQGEVGFYCPEAAFRPPFLAYRSINQSVVQEGPLLAGGESTYCIYAGGAKQHRRFECGTSRRPDWLFQDQRAGSGVFRYVAVPSLKAGEEWRGVFHCVRRSPEPYPPIGFDQSREERGILPALLADAVTDGFTIVPARASRYTYTGRPLAVTFRYYARDAQPRSVRLNCRLVDLWGREVARREVALANEGRPTAILELPVTLPWSGAYRMEIATTCGEVKRTRELVLAALPEIPDTGYRPDSVFGAAIGGGTYLGTLAHRIGLKWNRAHCAIGDSQAGTILPERGRYTWDALEEAYAFHQRYRLLACHSISEGWTAPWLSALWKERPFEEYLKAYVEEYVRPLALRFKGRIRCWEVTNEPYYQFRDCPEKWVALMKATYQTLKEVDPQCTVVGTCGPPGSMGYAWYRRTFALGALQYQDAVSSHLYHFGPWVGAGTEMQVRKWMQEIRAIMKENGRVVPLWNSETTVSPPASLYRHPSHQRYITYAAGTGPTDPIEQAQIYFKVLVIHKAEDVKYSFHIFHGGIEHDSHTAEYDETPLAFLAAQAALARHLESAQYVGDVPLHGDLQACLFRQGRRLILIPWGPMFLKRDCAQVTLPLPARRFTARDIFDNPLPVEGDARATRLQVTWEAFLLVADGMSVEELKQACAGAKVAVHFAQAQGSALKGTFGGEGAGPASRADWVGFHAVDLAPAANRGFQDDEPDDGRGGWTDEGPNDMRFLPTGEWRVNGVPFRILDPEENAGKGCVVLKGGPSHHAPFPERVAIPVGRRVSKLHFLHTATWASTGQPAFRYVLHFADGVTEEVPVHVGRNVENWWNLGPLPEAQMAWEGPNAAHEKVRLFHAQYEIRHPKGAQAVLDRIEVIGGGRPIPVVVAITGVLSN